MEDFAVKGDIHSDVQIFPVPVIADVILGQTLAFDQLACKTNQPLHYLNQTLFH
jgi:hypothetical protein